MGKQKLNELDPAAITLTRLLGHANPATGKMNRATFSDLVALFSAQTPVKTYANETALLANTDLAVGYIAYNADTGGFYLYNGPAANDIDNYTLINPEGDEHFKGVFASEAALEAAFPTAEEGDYAFVDTGGTDAALYIWDDTDSDWLASGVTTVVPDASETTKGIAELATQAETNTGTDDARIVTPLKLHVKNQQNSSETSSRAIAQTDDQKILRANSASAIAFDFPSLAANTWVIVVQQNAGAVSFTTSGGVSFVNTTTPAIAGGAIGSGIAFFYLSTTSVLAFVGDVTNLLTSLSINGTLAIKAGASSGQIAKVGGKIFTETTTVGNVLTGEDTLYTYTVPANTLNANEDSLTGWVAGTFAATANNKRVRVKCGATTILDTTALAFNTGTWKVEFKIVRTGATTQKCISQFTSSNSLLTIKPEYQTAAETLSGTFAIAVTGEATASNDIVAQIMEIFWHPHE